MEQAVASRPTLKHAPCKKCGTPAQDWRYCQYGSNCEIYGFQVEQEHLHYACIECGFEWSGKTLDGVDINGYPQVHQYERITMCPKCSTVEHHKTDFHKGQKGRTPCMGFPESTGPAQQPHMHRTCAKCKYEWPEFPLG